jgi:hypothetical protein
MLPDKFEYPPLSLQEWNKLMEPSFAPWLRPYSNPAAVKAVIAEVAAQVRALQERGTRVIFYNPPDPRIRSMAPATEFFAEIEAQMPGIEYIDAPDDQFPIYRRDGMHFSAASGLQFFEYLMKYANLQFTPLCQIVPKPRTYKATK